MSGRSRVVHFLLSWVLLQLSVSRAVVITNSQLKKSYDFVIVGGGTAGSVVASRLTEDPRTTVLVIESGPTEEGVEVGQIPFLAHTMAPNTPWDWNYTTAPQQALNGRNLIYPRGHILGGCSSANAMVWTRGSPGDFNKYAEITGDKGWRWDNIVKYYKNLERWSLPADNHNITGQFDPEVHGYNGLLNVSLSGFPAPINEKVLAASAELGPPYQFNLDVNSDKPSGISWLQLSINKSVRSSSATAYLHPTTTRQRPNLAILLNTRVSRVLTTGSDHGVPSFRSVEFSTTPGGPLQTVTATKEVILSAGAIGTPHILLNSGIGDSAALSKVGVKLLVHLPDVGKGLHDHAYLANPWNANTTDTFDNYFQNKTYAEEALQEWRTTGQGLLVTSVSTHVGYYRFPKNLTIWETHPDPASSPDTPQYEHLFANFFPVSDPPPTGHFFGVGIVILAPTSRGSVTLASADPFADPIIDPNFLATELDKVLLREALKSAQHFMSASVLKGYVLDQADRFAGVKTDAQIDAYLAAHAGTIWHPTATASMSHPDSASGVTNPDLTVKKVAGLRIIDASIFPFIPATHVQAPVYAVAERGSDIVKAKYKLS